MNNTTSCAHTDGFHFDERKIDGVLCRVRACPDCGQVKDEPPEILEKQAKVDLRPSLSKCQRLP